MKSKIYQVIIILLLATALEAKSSFVVPESPNQLDENGFRTGKWTAFLDSLFLQTIEQSDASYFRIINYRKGKPEGIVLSYYITGEIESEMYLVTENPDTADGKIIEYYRNGKTKSIFYRKHGIFEGKNEIYYPNGTINTRGYYKNGFKDGVWELILDNGIKKREITFKNGKKNGKYTEYYDSGELYGVTNYNDDIENGTTYYFHKNGNKFFSGQIVNNNCEGKFQYWKEDGSPDKEINFFRTIIDDNQNLVAAWNSNYYTDQNYSFALEIAKRIFRKNVIDYTIVDTTDIFSNVYLGLSYYKLSNYDSAIIYLKEGINLYEKLKSNIIPEEKDFYLKLYLNAYQDYAISLRESNDLQKSLQVFETLINIIDKNDKYQNSKLGMIYFNMGELLQMTKEYNKSEDCFKKALNLLQIIYAENKWECDFCCEIIRKIAELKFQLKNLEESLKVNFEALSCSLSDTTYTANLNTYKTYNNIAMVLKRLNKFDSALAIMRQNEQFIYRNYGNGEGAYYMVIDSIAKLLHELGRDEEADSVYRFTLIFNRYSSAIKNGEYFRFSGSAINYKLHLEGYPESLILERIFRMKECLSIDTVGFRDAAINKLKLMYDDMRGDTPLDSFQIFKNCSSNQTWQTLSDSGKIYFNSGYYIKAKEVVRQSLVKAIKRLPGNSRDLIALLTFYSKLCFETGETNISWATNLVAKQMILKYYSINDTLFPELLLLTGDDYSLNGKIYEAERIYKSAQNLMEENSNENTNIYFLSKLAQSEVEISFGDYKFAAIYLNKLQNLAQQNVSIKLSNYEKAKLYYRLGNLYEELTNYSLCFKYYSLAYRIISTEIKEKNIPKDSFDNYYIAFQNLIDAKISLLENNMEDASDKISKAQKYFIEQQIICHSQYFDILLSKAYYFQLSSKFSEAENCLIETQKIASKCFITKHPVIGIIQNALGNIYVTLGRHNEALKAQLSAIRIERQSTYNLYRLARYYSDIGVADSYFSKTEYTEGYFNDSKKLLETAHLTDIIIYAQILSNLGNMYSNSGRLDSAEEFLSKSITVFNKFNPNNISKLYPLNSLGNLNIEKKNYQKAIDYFNEILGILFKFDKDNSPILALVFGNLGASYLMLNDFKNAFYYLKESTQYLLKFINRNNYNMTENELEKLLDDVSDKFRFFNSFVITYCDSVPNIITNLVTFRASTKGYLISNQLKMRNRLLQSNDTGIQNKISYIKILKDKIGRLSSYSKSDLASLGINIDSLKREVVNSEKEISYSLGSKKNLEEEKEITFKEIQNKLKSDEAYVDVIRYYLFKDYTNLSSKTNYAALIITKETKEQPELVIIGNGAELEDRFLKDYKENIRNSNSSETAFSESFNKLWKPINNKLNGIKKVFLSNDGVYNQINLNTLYNSETGKFVIEELDIQLVSNSQDFFGFGEKDSESIENYAELFGNPNFRLDKTNYDLIARGYDIQNTSDMASSLPDSLTRGRISDLPGTKVEIEEIEKLAITKNWKVKTHLGDEAIEEAVKAVKSPRLLVLATHGFFLDDIQMTRDARQSISGMDKAKLSGNPLLRSGLYLSGAEKTINADSSRNLKRDNGILTALEVLNMNLDNTELVVLSACQTGLGVMKNGEGVYGLQRAFLIAGAKSVVMSLWSVNDNSTKDLMVSFYDKWFSGTEKHNAFKQAQLEIMKKYKHPYYWGPFVMVGE